MSLFEHIKDKRQFQKVMLVCTFIIIMVVLIVSKDVSRGILYISLFTQFLIISTYLGMILYRETDNKCPLIKVSDIEVPANDPVDSPPIGTSVPGTSVSDSETAAEISAFDVADNASVRTMVGMGTSPTTPKEYPYDESQFGEFNASTWDIRAAQDLLANDNKGGQHSYLQNTVAENMLAKTDLARSDRMSDKALTDTFHGLNPPQRLHYVRGDGYFPIEYQDRQLQASKRSNLYDDDLDEHENGHWINEYRDERAFEDAKKKGTDYFSAYGDHVSPYANVTTGLHSI